MASLPRGSVVRALTLAARSRTAALRPNRLFPVSTWRAVSSTSLSSWKRLETPQVARPSLLPALTAHYPLLRVGRRSSGVAITAEELDDKVLAVLKMFDKVNPENVTLEAHFINDLGMDSLDAVEVVMAFEDEFGVEITDEEAEKIFTCKDAVELLKTKLDIH